MDLQQPFALALRITIFAIVLATGLATTGSDLAYLRRRPGLLLRSLLAVVVIAPLVAVALWRVLPMGPAAAIAIVAGALAPGIPMVPDKVRKAGGNVSFARALMLITSSLAVLTIPLWLEILRHIAGIDAGVPLPAIVRTLALGLLLPLGVGMVIRRVAPTLAARIAAPVDTAANMLLPGLALVVLIVGASAVLELSAAALLAMVLAPAIALAVGHLLGGPDPRDRTVLAIENAGRFPALAALVAAAGFPQVHALPTVIAFLVISTLVTLPYAAWRKRTHRASPGAGRATSTSAAGAPVTYGAPARR